MFRCVAGFIHILTFIDGHTAVGAVRATPAELTKSSAMPFANFARIFAVAGTTRKRSHAWLAFKCDKGVAITSNPTGCPDNV